MTKSQFARRHTFEALTEAEQIAFAQEMIILWRETLVELHGLKDQHDYCKDQVKYWDLERKDVEKHAIEHGLAFKEPQDYNVRAKEAYVQTRHKFTWK